MSIKQPSFSFGIEEEYHLVDLESGDLKSAPDEMMAELERSLGRRVSPEFLRSQVEIGTGVSHNFADARVELAGLRREIARAARKHGMAPIAASTHPFALLSSLETTDKERYQKLAHDLAGIGRRLAICGMHVHVGIEDDELRIDIMNQVRYFLPHLLMLSTSSPFWQGDDSGMKSYRVSVFDEMPRSGLPGKFDSFGEFQRTVDVLVRGGVIEDATKIWWDVRPSARFPTLELRITDVCPRLDDAMTIAALYVCIARMLFRLRSLNLRWRGYPLLLLEENRWRAQRYGVRDSLFDFGKGDLIPFAELIEELLALLAPDAAALGCEAEIANAREIVRRGTGADRQVAAYQDAIDGGAGKDAALRSVVDWLVVETLDGI